MRIPAPQIPTITVLLVSLLLSPVALTAQNNLSDWSHLNAVALGSKLSVKLKDGKTVEGTLRSVSDSGLSLTVKNADRELRRDDVQTVHELSKKSVKKATLIGLGVGAGVGALAAAVTNASSDNNGFEIIDEGVAVAAVAILGAGVGAISGFFIGRSGKKRALVYKAR
jgi:small nuclear ribonucleoprotein (snRNP)-like protein